MKHLVLGNFSLLLLPGLGCNTRRHPFPVQISSSSARGGRFSGYLATAVRLAPPSSCAFAGFRGLPFHVFFSSSPQNLTWAGHLPDQPLVVRSLRGRQTWTRVLGDVLLHPWSSHPESRNLAARLQAALVWQSCLCHSRQRCLAKPPTARGDIAEEAKTRELASPYRTSRAAATDGFDCVPRDLKAHSAEPATMPRSTPVWCPSFVSRRHDTQGKKMRNE